MKADERKILAALLAKANDFGCQMAEREKEFLRRLHRTGRSWPLSKRQRDWLHSINARWGRGEW